MKRILGTLAILVLLAGIVFANGEAEGGAASAAMPTEATPGYTSVDIAGVNVQWKIDGDMISLQISAATTGWIAVGFDPSKQMADANIVIGYVADGQVFLRDDYGVGNVKHGADVDNGGTDNLSDVTGSEENGVTTIRFSMPLDSGDPLDRALSAGSTHKILASHGPDGADDFGTYHASRGSVETEL